VLDATGIDRDDALTGHRDVATASVGHFESVTAPMPNPQLGTPTPIGHDPDYWSIGPRAYEADPKPRAMPKVRRVDEVDDGDDVAAGPLPIQREEGKKQSAKTHEPKNSDNGSRTGIAFEE
jgi:hypothetical protein